MVLTALSKCFGLFRDIILSYYYGTSYISDAILISISIPASLLGIAINGIANGFVPIFRDIEENERNYNSNDFSIVVIGIVVIISTIIFFFIYAFTGFLVKVYVGFEGKVFDLAVKFTKITSFSAFFYGLLFILQKYLNLKIILQYLG